ncbi:tumor necrosis factor receptor superfamily member 14-like [Festucalex cinctus]
MVLGNAELTFHHVLRHSLRGLIKAGSGTDLCGLEHRWNKCIELTLWIFLTYVFRGHTLECHPTAYQLSDKQCCPKCPIGTRVRNDCPKRGSTSCQPCADGTYMNIPTGLKNCFPCKNCNAESGLRIKKACTSDSDAACEPLDGFFCVDVKADGCLEARKHADCQPGQYRSRKGTAFNNTICSDCTGETFSNGTSTFCQQHTKCESSYLLKMGTATTDAECGEKRFPKWAIVSIIMWILCLAVLATLCLTRNRKQHYVN